MIKITTMLLSFIVSIPVFAETIEWKVENPFRFIQNNQNSHYSIGKNQTSIDFLDNLVGDRNAAKLPPIQYTQWDRNSNKIQRLPKNYAFPEVVLVSAWLPETRGSCEWKYGDYYRKADCTEKILFYAQTQFGNMNKTTLTVKILDKNKIVSEKVIVKDKLILGLGDSYASGEGNPDSPTIIDENKLNSLAHNNSSIITTGRWMKNKDLWVKDNAEWLDKQCHRSLFSQHILAGMKLASLNDKESITLIPLACSGAEILDGLLVSQENPPGGGKRVKESQLNAAIRYLCPPGSKLEAENTYYDKVYTGGKIKKIGESRFKCSDKIRTPDVILLSVGGNDVGFAPAITWAALPAGYRNPFGWSAIKITNKFTKPICPKYNGQKICYENRPVAKDRVKNWLPKYYEYLSNELYESGLSKDGSNVYLTAYPNPSFIEDGSTYCSVKDTADALEQARTQLPRIVNTGVWNIQITPSELKDINIGLIEPLYKQMKMTAKDLGWNFVDQHVDQTLSHGLCAGYHRDSKNIPIFPHIRMGKWYPEKPNEEWAFDTSKQRWYRNTNDALLFQTDDTDGGINGAFHPDFRMHALIADHLVEAITFKK